MEGCPWSFNRKALIMKRLSDGENPRSVELKKLEMWVQIHDLKVGFMTERILASVGTTLEPSFHPAQATLMAYGENTFESE